MSDVVRNLRDLTREEILGTLIEVEVKDEEFLKVKETLTRIGIPNRDRTKLFQSCHILHKKGRYYILSFKELFGLDGRVVEMTSEDYARRDHIATLLEKWGLVKLITKIEVNDLKVGLLIVPYKDKKNWQLCPKYEIGKKLNGNNHS